MKDLRDLFATDPEVVNAFRRRFNWSEDQTIVTTEEGQALAKEIGAAKYFETSAKTKEGVRELFIAAAKLAWKPRRSFKNCRFL